MKHIAIIGTAGRDKSKPMTKKLWEAMWKHASSKFVGTAYHLYSGGSAWADHLAVVLYLNGEVDKLTLHLPAPLDAASMTFRGGDKTAGSAINYYHEMFSKAIGASSRNHLLLAIANGAIITEQAVTPGYGAMFARNNLVARDAKDGVLAYTWGAGKEVADGGTKHTWDRCGGRKVHVPLTSLEV